jgi:hypothetical protein
VEYSLLLVAGAWLLVLCLPFLLKGLAATVAWCARRWGQWLGNPLAPEARAQTMLHDLLEEHEYQQLVRCGYLEVASPGHAQRLYRIPAADGLVRVYEQDVALADLCVQPAEPLPRGDVVLLHKLMIEGNEAEYLARANQFPPIGGCRRLAR